ncbi:uncharacterized protein LOC126827806 [Patella vulgata]|uniref:uncharacterized protein LOC126827806 n=1 Tax=Patella vulgata TaxID=6465 RepID=UPI002180860D|nr:uncharacterized protein LOC126827806 [Patella vulgata]XP_050413323.1 uncharacterized protein LOC126827806 [Patella vulgata]XP_050413324.1 uncharacterized protein LOC126827806 [Patella vulgata]XP_050413325.1 uncharacterized protein LOC126827806 [Patella vulgata]
MRYFHYFYRLFIRIFKNLWKWVVANLFITLMCFSMCVMFLVILSFTRETTSRNTPDHPPVTNTCIGGDVMFRCCYVVLTYKTSLPPPADIVTWERNDESVKPSRRQFLTTKYQKLGTDTRVQSFLVQSYKIDSTLDIYGVQTKDLGRYKCYVVGSKSFIPLIASSCEAMSRDPRPTCECDVTGDFYQYTATEKKIAAIFKKGVTVNSISEFDLHCDQIDNNKWWIFWSALILVLIVLLPIYVVLKYNQKHGPRFGNVNSYLTTRYRVFLSYNDHNYDYIKDEIMPFLNEFNIKYFDKQFDIIPGRHKLHEIGEAIGRSEAFIVIASHQFVNEFEQNTFEMNMLLNKATKNNLVILKIDDCVIDDVFNCYKVIDWTGDRVEATYQLQEWTGDLMELHIESLPWTETYFQGNNSHYTNQCPSFDPPLIGIIFVVFLFCDKVMFNSDIDGIHIYWAAVLVYYVFKELFAAPGFFFPPKKGNNSTLASIKKGQ